MAAQPSQPLIHVEGLSKDYRMGDNVVHALRSVSLEVYPGEFVAVMGASGSGKSTFMNLLGCLDRPTGGVYRLEGTDVAGLSGDDLAAVRNRKIGFIFQGFNLLARMTAEANVALPLAYAGADSVTIERRKKAALAAVGLGERAAHRPNELSGGQQQRVAIARALVTGPSIILADEPTGNLDSRTSVEIMALLQQLNAHGITIVMVTHEPDIAAFCKRVVIFRDGQVVDDHLQEPRDAAAVLASLPTQDSEKTG
jgi:putative ABC transport system ATP-binding protein